MGKDASIRQLMAGLAGLTLMAACQPADTEEPAGTGPESSAPASDEAPATSEVYGDPPHGTREALPRTVIEGPDFTLTELWQLDGFDDPQGVLHLPDGSYLIANSGGGRGEIDADGWISKVSAGGEMLAERFAVGMIAPGGMVLDRGVIYVADGDTIHMVDPDNGILMRSIAVPGAGRLSDITALNASLYAVDGSDGTLYQIAGADVAEWVQDERLTGARSLVADQDGLLVPVGASGSVYRVDEAKRVSETMSGLTGVNAVAPLEAGYLATAAPGRIVAISGDGTHETLLDTEENGILQAGIHVFGDTVVTLNPLPGTVKAWQIGPANAGASDD